MKPVNPKDYHGVRKPGLSATPTRPLFLLGLAMQEGALKYGRHNYRESPVLASVYYDAAMRHLTAWWEGETTDPDSGLPHLTKAMACLCILLDTEHAGTLMDDRPAGNPDLFSDLNEMAKAIADRYPDPPPAPALRERACTDPDDKGG